MPRPRTDFPKELFYIHRHDPGRGALSEQEWKLEFEAHIVSVNDTSSPSYSEFFDMGRADPKVFYAGANRQLQISFFLDAVNEEENINNHD